jgi:galactokinase
MDKLVIRNLRECFLEKFRSPPLLVFSPGRINLIGEHTDYNLGFALPAAIDIGITMAIQTSKANVCTAIAIDRSESFTFELHSLEPLPAGGWQNYILGVADEIRKKGKQLPNFDLVFGGNIPPGAGLSSSAALENAMVYGINELFQLGLSKMEMIHISQAAEHNFAGVQCGIMDQFASMFGQEDMALFLDCRTLNSEPIPFRNPDYQLLLLNTNVAHHLADSAYNDRRELCRKAAQFCGVSSLRDLDIETLKAKSNLFTVKDYQKILFVLEENLRVLDAVTTLKKNDLHGFGELLFASHAGLKLQYEVSCEELDYLVDLAKVSDAVLGARMMGGGFGGCTLNLVHKDRITSFVQSAQDKYTRRFGKFLSPVPVNISGGTRHIP